MTPGSLFHLLTRSLARFRDRSGILIALAALCAFFSLATLETRVPEGPDAARGIADAIARNTPLHAAVLPVLSKTPEDTALAPRLEAALRDAGLQVLETVSGEPPDARARLEQLSRSGTRVEAFACSRTTAAWRVLADAPTDFPGVGKPVPLTARPARSSNFLKPSNLLNITNQIAVIAIVAAGMTLVIVSGGIDLSVGSLIALAAVVAARLIRDVGGADGASALAMVLCSAAAVATTGGLGIVSGVIVTRFRVPPFIATLSMMLVTSGLAYILSRGQSIYQIPESYVWLGRGTGPGAVPNAVLLTLFLYASVHVLMTRRRIGRHLYAVGGNAEAARLAGVPVRRVICFAYGMSGLLAGLGGVVMASQLKSGSPTYGGMYELYVIAAVVVGGTSLSGGEGSVLGTLLGALTIAVIQNGMNLLNIESYTQKVILGLVILAAVLLDTRRRRAR
jgi:ribose transport system permease protein